MDVYQPIYNQMKQDRVPNQGSNIKHPVKQINVTINENIAKKSINDWVHEVHMNAVEHGWWENPRTPGELLMLVVSEASEAFEEIRNGHKMTETYYSDNNKIEGVPSELADIVIRVMDLCGYYNIDLEEIITKKHEYNKIRPYKHGGKVL